MNSRADSSSFAAWWWTIDRVALLAMLALIAIGLMLAFAASPAATGGPVTAGNFRYAAKQIAFAGIAAGHPGRRVAAVAAAAQDRGRGDVRAGADRLVPGAVRRQRSARREALDRFRLVDAAAVGIPQARLCGAGAAFLADRSANAACPSRVITLLLIVPALADPAAAARCRPDGAAARAVGRAAVLRRRIA